MLSRRSLASSTITTADMLPLLGIRLSYLDRFIQQCGINKFWDGRQRLKDLTTAQVCERFVKPRTKPSRSICDHLDTKSPADVGPANWFISHSWQCKFLDVVDAIQAYFHNQGIPDVTIWLDLFSLPQHGRGVIAAGWLQNTFLTAIPKIGNVLMVLTPWKSPITLSRAWCVFELYACASTKSKFDIALPPSEVTAFHQSFVDDPRTFYQTIASVKLETAGATIKADLDAIRQVIRDSVGFWTLDRTVFSVLFSWMVSTLEGQLRELESAGDGLELARFQMSLGELYVDQGYYHDADLLLTSAEQLRRRLLGPINPLTLMSLDSLISLYESQGEYDKAEPLYIDYLHRIQNERGKLHPSTLERLYELAVLYHSQGMYDKAEPLYIDHLLRAEITFGKDHQQTIVSMSALGRLYRDQKDDVRAKPLCIDCVDRAKRVLGEDHPDTLTCVQNLASICARQGDVARALELQLDCLDKRRRVFGDCHKTTVESVDTVASLYAREGKYDLAESLCRESLDSVKKVVGDNHPYYDKLADCLVEVRRARRTAT
ncbi:Kinesin light chain 3 [Rhizophlyctis rosea]|nr:Kinesin light chain 3 [Rhizophlyctis rosea]